MAKKSTATPVAEAPKAPAADKKKMAANGAAVVAETAAAVRNLTEIPAAGPITEHVNGQLNGHSPASQHLEAQYIEVYGAREHNLKNVSVKIPRNRLVVFTGISGSGKSSLAFDTIYAEGQRRYMETFSAYAR